MSESWLEVQVAYCDGESTGRTIRRFEEFGKAHRDLGILLADALKGTDCGGEYPAFTSLVHGLEIVADDGGFPDDAQELVDALRSYLEKQTNEEHAARRAGTVVTAPLTRRSRPVGF